MSGYNEAIREAVGEFTVEAAHEMLANGEFDEQIIEMILTGDFDEVIEDRVTTLMEERRLDDQIKYYLGKVLTDSTFELVAEQL